MKEGVFALPPLELLVVLPKGRVDPEMREVLTMTELLKKEMLGPGFGLKVVKYRGFSIAAIESAIFK